MSEIYPLPDYLEFCLLIDCFCACRLANPHHASLTLSDRYFTLFTWSHICAFLCRFYSVCCVVIHCHLPALFHFTLLRLFCGMLSPISYDVTVSFAFFVFVRHTDHCFLSNSKLHVICG